jgi:hypothetical protein
MGARSHILVVDDDARLRNAAGKVDCQDSRSALPFWRNALDPIVETRMLWSHNGFSLKQFSTNFGCWHSSRNTRTIYDRKP